MFRDVTIHPVMNGFQVVVGCQTIVFETINGLMTALNDYLHDPRRTEVVWRKAAINAKYVEGAGQPFLEEAQGVEVTPGMPREMGGQYEYAVNTTPTPTDTPTYRGVSSASGGAAARTREFERGYQFGVQDAARQLRNIAQDSPRPSEPNRDR